MAFELSYADIAILFFLTLGPLKAILPWSDPRDRARFPKKAYWRSVPIAAASFSA